MLDDNIREEEERKKETKKKTATHKVCLQQKQSGYFQQWQEFMENISYPSKTIILVSIIYLSSNTLKEAFSTLEVIWETSQTK